MSPNKNNNLANRLKDAGHKHGEAADGIDIIHSEEMFGMDQDRIAVVLYQGNLNGAKPQEMHIDFENHRLTVLFNNGIEKEIAKISPEQVVTLHKLQSVFEAAKVKDIYGGFFRVDDTNTMVPGPGNHIDLPIMFLG